MPLKDIKDKESRAIFNSYSSQDFIQFLKKLSEMKKISVIRKDNAIMIRFEFEAMFMKHEIEIELGSKDQNIELLEKEVKELKKRIDDLETEVKEIKKMLNPNFNINRIKIGNKSVIMKENEFDLIHLAIKSRLNKEVKELKKLYQATIDGDGAINFHSRCDNIPNTLVLIKSAGNRRFGGFTSVQWTSPTSSEYKDDPNAFLFSLDKQKIYSYKKNGKAIYCYKDYGPEFGAGCDIGINQHGIQEKHLHTYESYSGCSYNYNGDNNALSEDGKASWIYAAEYEVFQVIFS
jgi:cell division protein FtsB